MNLGIPPLSAGGLSLIRVLGSLSRTLGVVRQVAPLYRDLKPLLSKAPQMLAKLNGIRTNINNISTQTHTFIDEINRPYEPNNSQGPVFFQWNWKSCQNYKLYFIIFNIYLLLLYFTCLNKVVVNSLYAVKISLRRKKEI